jgi:hypothetical protein
MALIRLLAYVAAIVLPASALAGPYMSWEANEYYMIDGDAVDPSSIPSTPSAADSKLLEIRQLIIWRAGEPDRINRCYANYAKSGNPTRVYCEQIEGASLSGAVWLTKRRNVFRCVSACRPSVPKIITRSLDG